MTRTLLLILVAAQTAWARFPAAWDVPKPVTLTNAGKVKISAIAQYRTWEWTGYKNETIDALTNEVSDHLTAYYPFNSTNEIVYGRSSNAGSNAVDYSVSNRPATVFVGTSSGATWYAASGVTSAYYSFDGGDFIRSTRNYNGTTQNLTISCWFMSLAVSNAGSVGIFSLGTNGTSATLSLRALTNNSMFTYGNNLGVVSTNSIIPNTWIFAAGVQITNSLILYINGSYNGISYLGSSFLPSMPYYVGALGNDQIPSRRFIGYIDDCRIYNTALTALQVTNIFEATKRSHPNPLWP